MVCSGFEPGAAGWKAQTNPRCCGGLPCFTYFDFLTDVKYAIVIEANVVQ